MARKYPMILRRDETFRVVFNLRTPAQGGLEKVGTGIFVAKENELFLVTANHVAIDCNVNTSLVVSDTFDFRLTNHFPVKVYVMPNDEVHMTGQCKARCRWAIY